MARADSPGCTPDSPSGAGWDLSSAKATAISASAGTKAEGLTVSRPATGTSGSAATLSTRESCMPRLAAWRRRCASNG